MFDIIPELYIETGDYKKNNTCETIIYGVINNEHIPIDKCIINTNYSIKLIYNVYYNIDVYYVIDNNIKIIINEFKIIRDVHRKFIMLFGNNYIDNYEINKNNKIFIDIIMNAYDLIDDYDLDYITCRNFQLLNKNIIFQEYDNIFKWCQITQIK
jgi:hypothetical protein